MNIETIKTRITEREQVSELVTSLMDMQKEWFEEEVKVDAVTVADFQKYCASYLEVRKAADELDRQLTEKNVTLQKMQTKLIEYMTAQGISKYETPYGTIQAIEKNTWKASEGDARQEVVEHLKAIGQYDAITAFNANKFHGWFKAEKESNPGFHLPGVELNTIKYIRLNAKKG
jgi:hypothetical protein